MKGHILVMFKDKRIAYLYLVPLILISFILFRLVNNLENIFGWVKNFIAYLSGIANYIICGFCIAYILNSPMNFFMKKLKLKKRVALILVYVILLGVVTLLFVALIPMIVNSMTELFYNLPVYYDNMNRAYWAFISEIDEEWLLSVQQQAIGILPLFQDTINQFISSILNTISFSSITSALTGTTGVLLTALFGFVLSIYMLWDKEKLLASIKKVISGIFNEKAEQKILNFGSLANRVFSSFIIGKALDSAIMLVLCFICTSALNIHYALIISIIVGITNMIPYFGPLIGIIICALLSLFVSPFQALEVVILLFILQQFDGLILGPKILSNQVGMSPILIITGITIGGNLGGLIGMFLGVPIIAIIKIILYDEWIERRIQKKKQAKAQAQDQAQVQEQDQDQEQAQD